jgi:putative spermidine/putrescine transport system substrate-binding protein
LVFRQQVNEVQQGLEKHDRQSLKLEAKAAKLDKPEKVVDATPEELTIVSVGGPFSKGRIEAIQKPFTKKTGIKINNAAVYDDGLAKLKDQALTGNPGWDLINLDNHLLCMACEAGLIEPIDWSILSPAPDGTPVGKDFIPGALHKCGVATVVWATIIAYDKTKFAGDNPSKLSDFFDVKKFPGMRAVSNHPAGTLELASMADGVSVDQVYQSLSTKEGVDRAFKKLDTIKEFLVFWDASAQPADMLADGEVIMTTAYNSRIFDAQIKMDKPFAIIWDHQIYGMDYYAILKRTKNMKSAVAYMKFAATSDALADQASWEPYGPTRKSSIPLVKTYHGTDIKMAPHLPTSPDNFRNGLALDYKWWAEKQDIMLNRFKIWKLK